METKGTKNATRPTKNATRPGELRNAYAVVVNSDTCEGRGHNYDLAYFWLEGEARRCAKGKGTMGCDARVEPRDVVFLENKEWSLVNIVNVESTLAGLERESARMKLLKSLSEKELQLLEIQHLVNG